MVLLSFLLVLAAAVTLVIGLVGTGLGLIYVSIACSLAAGLVLAVAVVRSRPATELAAAGPAPLPGSEPVRYAPSAPVASRTSLAGGMGVLERDEDERPTGSLDVGERIRVFADPVVPSDPVEEDDVEPAGEDVFAPVADDPVVVDPEPVAPSSTWDVSDDDWVPDDDDDDDVFPIAEYDTLRVSQIVPLLGQLDADELETVRARELEVKGGRASVLNRIDALLGRPVTAKKAPAAAAKKTPPAAKRAPASAAKKTASKKAAAPAPSAASAPLPAAARKTTAKKVAAKKAAPPAAKKAAATKATKAAKKQP